MDPDLESLGLDEANLDLTEYLKKHNITTDEEVNELCLNVRKKIENATNGLTCSCGIGPNLMLAKIAANINKPDGQY